MKISRLAALAAACSLAVLFTGCGKTPASSSAESDPAVISESRTEESKAAQESKAAEKPDIGSELTVGILPVTVHAGDKNVPVSVQIWNNPGFSAAGIQVFYDSKLKPVTIASDNQFSDAPGGKCDLGDAAEGFLKSCLVGVEDHVIAFGGMAGQDSMEDGTIFTVYFDIPDDAPSGQSFDLTCVIDSISNAGKTKLNPKTYNGTITVE